MLCVFSCICYNIKRNYSIKESIEKQMLKIENVTIEYPDGTMAVDNISFEISKGAKFALIGANGAGKSTLLLAIEGLINSNGKIIVDNQLFMPSIYDDIAFGPRNLGLDEKTVEYRVNDRLKLLGIEHLKNKTALKMSGGEKRMASLATVLAMKPEIMLLDEPTAFLDPKARRNLINVLNSLPHTMLVATHDLVFADEICEYAIILRDGKLFAQGKCKELLYDKDLMDKGGVEAIRV